MAQQYGLSFQPGSDNGQQQSGYRAPVQQAIKLLSLRLPSVVGARAIAPQALLEGGGSQAIGGPGGLSGNALIEWLRKQMQQSGAQAPPQAQSAFQPSAPFGAAGSMLGIPTLSAPSFGGGGTSGNPQAEEPRFTTPGSPSPSPSPRRPDVVVPSAPTPQPRVDTTPRELAPPPHIIVDQPSDNADPPLRDPEPSPFIEPVYPDYKNDLYTDYQSPFDIYL